MHCFNKILYDTNDENVYRCICSQNNHPAATDFITEYPLAEAWIIHQKCNHIIYKYYTVFNIPRSESIYYYCHVVINCCTSKHRYSYLSKRKLYNIFSYPQHNITDKQRQFILNCFVAKFDVYRMVWIILDFVFEK